MDEQKNRPERMDEQRTEEPRRPEADPGKGEQAEERAREVEGNRGPEEEPGFGQGA